MSKRRILIALLGIIILSQFPFAYRRYRLSRLQNTIQQLSSQRISLPTSDYVDYQGAIHVHTALGGHSTGNFADLIAGAGANQLDFVVMTEHPQADFDTSALTLNGLHGGVLFLNGNEVVTANSDRLLLLPGTADAATMNQRSTQEIVQQQKATGGLAFAAYPAESQNWKTTLVDGVEVYDLFTNARRIRPLVMFFDGLWSYSTYPDLLFANFFQRPDANLQQWDLTIAGNRRRLVGIAGNDAHANVGISFNDLSGKKVAGLKLDPYERSFHVVRTHVLIKKDEALSRESLLRALATGHCYISFDLFGNARGFSFSIENANQIMGDESPAANQTLLVSAPLVSSFVLLKDGVAISQQTGTAARFSTAGAGSYRIEAYLDALPSPAKGKPWIISNPIYLR